MGITVAHAVNVRACNTHFCHNKTSCRKSSPTALDLPDFSKSILDPCTNGHSKSDIGSPTAFPHLQLGVFASQLLSQGHLTTSRHTQLDIRQQVTLYSPAGSPQRRMLWTGPPGRAGCPPCPVHPVHPGMSRPLRRGRGEPQSTSMIGISQACMSQKGQATPRRAGTVASQLNGVASVHRASLGPVYRGSEINPWGRQTGLELPHTLLIETALTSASQPQRLRCCRKDTHQRQ